LDTAVGSTTDAVPRNELIPPLSSSSSNVVEKDAVAATEGTEASEAGGGARLGTTGVCGGRAETDEASVRLGGAAAAAAAAFETKDCDLTEGF
jgi:hypothetical protein